MVCFSFPSSVLFILRFFAFFAGEMNNRYPEACGCLRRLLRGLPSAVYHVVASTNLQRSGCVQCGIGQHSTYDCPFLEKEVAGRKAEALYRRWIALVAEELLIFSRSSSTTVYVEAAPSRFASRPDLPARPPRRHKRDPTIGNDGHPSELIQLQSVTRPILPTPAVRERVRPVQEPILPTPVMQEPVLRSALVRKDQQFPRQFVKPKPATHLTASLSSQRQPQSSNISNAANSNAAEVPVALPKAKATLSPRRTTQDSIAGRPDVHTPQMPHRPSSQPGGVPPPASQDLIDLSSQQQWEDDNTHMDEAAILCSIAKISRDVEMLQACVLGNRRSRDFTPGSADRGRPDKFIRIDETPSRPLDFSCVVAAASNSSEAISSSSSADSVHPSSATSVEYEDWDLERYIQARQFSARQRFWLHASDTVKEKIVRALYDQPAGTPATIQARENGWIPV